MKIRVFYLAVTLFFGVSCRFIVDIFDVNQFFTIHEIGIATGRAYTGEYGPFLNEVDGDTISAEGFAFGIYLADYELDTPLVEAERIVYLSNSKIASVWIESDSTMILGADTLEAGSDLSSHMIVLENGVWDSDTLLIEDYLIGRNWYLGESMILMLKNNLVAPIDQTFQVEMAFDNGEKFLLATDRVLVAP